VQFKNVSSVEPCLKIAESEDLSLHGNKLLVAMAIQRESVKKLNSDKSSGKQDKRNIYLAKEGCKLVHCTMC